MINIRIDQKDLRWLDTAPKFINEAIEKAMPKAALFAEGKAKKDFTKSRGSRGGLHVRTGNLRRSIIGEAQDLSMTLGSDVVYAAIHELGGSIARRNNITYIPKRPYLEPVFHENADKIEDILLNSLIREWERL